MKYRMSISGKKQYLEFNNYDKENIESKFNEYLKYGGLPAVTW